MLLQSSARPQSTFFGFPGAPFNHHHHLLLYIISAGLAGRAWE
jgi:hypothetical protein